MKSQRESVEEDNGKVVLRVAGSSNAGKVAGAIANFINEGKEVSVNAMGAGAVNQAVKAVAISRGIVVSHGIDLVCIPGFKDEIKDGMRRSSILIRIKLI